MNLLYLVCEVVCSCQSAIVTLLYSRNYSVVQYVNFWCCSFFFHFHAASIVSFGASHYEFDIVSFSFIFCYSLVYFLNSSNVLNNANVLSCSLIIRETLTLSCHTSGANHGGHTGSSMTPTT